MRVAVLNRGRDAFPGGDLVHIDSLGSALSRIGVERVYQPSETLTGDFDLFHIHHINLSWCRMNFEAAARFPHVPVVITTIFYPTEGLGVSFTEMRQWLERARAVVTYSKREALEISQATGFDGPFKPIPPGVDWAFYSQDDQCHVSMNRAGVLTVAARNGDKNCDKVSRLCNQLQIPFIQAVGISRAELPAVYKNARVFINASGHESFGLTILEGLAAGCRVLATKHSWALEWFPGIVSIDPDSQALDGIIYWAYNTYDWDYTPNTRTRFMTWDLEAQRMKALYKEVLA